MNNELAKVELARVAQWLVESKGALAFTGAGISTESGIPDFRSPGGVWAQSTPVMFDDFLADSEARFEYWRQKSISHDEFFQSRPNSGHLALADWERRGFLRGVITQNIDGLHREAGSGAVVELHGTARFITCLDCGQRYDADPLVKSFQANHAVPPCPACKNGRLKHATISFGQQLDPEVLDTALEWCNRCDLLLVLGSSLVVEPAASLPRLVASRGGRVVIINRDQTPQDGHASLVFHAGIGETLTQVANCVDEIASG